MCTEIGRFGPRRARFAPIAAAAALLATSCAGPAEDAATPRGTHAGGVGSGQPRSNSSACVDSGQEIVLVVERSAFEPGCVVVGAGAPITVSYHNKDTVGHNVVVRAGEDEREVLYRSAITLQGEAFVLPALRAGEYTIRCDTHPIMNGRVVVR